MSESLWIALRNLGLSFVLSLAYFGVLALLVSNLHLFEPKQAAILIAASLPVRLGAFGLAMVTLLRLDGLWGALSVVIGLWAGRFVMQRRVRMRQGLRPWV